MTSRTRPAVLVLLVLQLGFVLAAKIATPPADARVELDAADIAARAAPPSAKTPRSVFAKPGRPRVKLPGLLTNAGGLLKSPFALIATFRGPIGVMLARQQTMWQVVTIVGPLCGGWLAAVSRVVDVALFEGCGGPCSARAVVARAARAFVGRRER